MNPQPAIHEVGHMRPHHQKRKSTSSSPEHSKSYPPYSGTDGINGYPATKRERFYQPVNHSATAVPFHSYTGVTYTQSALPFLCFSQAGTWQDWQRESAAQSRVRSYLHSVCIPREPTSLYSADVLLTSPPQLGRFVGWVYFSRSLRFEAVGRYQTSIYTYQRPAGK